jgi:flagellar biosynthetic protein FliR
MGANWLNVSTIVVFLLILIRISGLFLSGPVLSNQNIPMMSKLGVALGISLILFAAHGQALAVAPPKDLIQFTVMAIQELTVGLMLGFALRTTLAGVQMAGDLISAQQGLTVANVLDPMTQSQVPVIGQFYYFMAMLVFLGLNLHHAMLLAFEKSFQWLPLGQAVFHSGQLAERFIVLTGHMFIIALMLGMPVFAVLLVTEVGLALTTKVMPQMNIFMVGLPFKISLGLIMILISLPSSAQYLTEQYETIYQQIMVLFRHA